VKQLSEDGPWTTEYAPEYFYDFIVFENDNLFFKYTTYVKRFYHDGSEAGYYNPIHIDYAYSPARARYKAHKWLMQYFERLRKEHLEEIANAELQERIKKRVTAASRQVTRQ